MGAYFEEYEKTSLKEAAQAGGRVAEGERQVSTCEEISVSTRAGEAGAEDCAGGEDGEGEEASKAQADREKKSVIGAQSGGAAGSACLGAIHAAG